MRCTAGEIGLIALCLGLRRAIKPRVEAVIRLSV
jgi:hypothetical protein